MTIDKVIELRNYYSNIGFDNLAGVFSSVLEDYNCFQDEIKNLKQKISELSQNDEDEKV